MARTCIWYDLECHRDTRNVSSHPDAHSSRLVLISSRYYTVNPQAINEEGTVDVFCENRRSVMILKRPSGSQIAIIAVGAMLVGSIKYNDGIKEGVEVRRGQCLGAFFYGGSTVITLYQKARMKLDEDLVKNSCEQKCETYVKVGWRLGVEL